MTREEAIDILNGMFCSLCSLQHPRRSHDENLTKLREMREEAIDMAISALSVLDQIKWERDAALTTLEEHGIGLGQKAEPKEKPKEKKDDDTLLKADSEDVKEQKSKLDGDVISRQWLLDLYGDYIGDNGDTKYHVPLEVVRQNIIDAPSAEAEPTVIRSRTLMPTKDFNEWAKRVREENGENVIVIPCDAELADRPKGEWIYHVDDLFPGESTQECSICHAVQPLNINDENFCPNCGADMRGGSE